MKKHSTLLALSALAASSARSQTLIHTVGDDPDSCDFGVHQLQEAIDQAAPGDVIGIAEDPIVTVTAPDGLRVDKSLAFKPIAPNCVASATGPAVLSGDDTNRIFRISGLNLDVSMTGLELENGAADEGGLIYVEGAHLTLERVKLSFGQSLGDGGCIDAAAADVTLLGTTVRFCGAGDQGGGISIVGGDLTLGNGFDPLGEVVKTELHGNSAADGGAVRIEYGTLSMTGQTELSFNDADGEGGGVFAARASVFVHGTARLWRNDAYHGGAVYLIGGPSPAAMSLWGQGSVHNNTASFGGGVFAVNASVYLQEASRMYGNAAAIQGGGIDASDSIVVIDDLATMSSNTAVFDGGGVVANGASDIRVRGEMSGNSAMDGGAIAAHSPTTLVKVSNSGSLSGNTATGSGGAIASDGATVLLQHQAELQGNSALRGGAIATQLGGSLHIAGGAGAVANGVRLVDNSAILGGGAIWVDSASLDAGQVEVSGNQATDSQLGGGGALLVTNGSTATLTNALLHANSARRGGAARVSGSSLTLDVDFSICDPRIDRGAERYCTEVRSHTGGAIFVTSQSELDVQRAAFVFNSGHADGPNAAAAAIDLDASSATIDGSVFHDQFIVNPLAPDEVASVRVREDSYLRARFNTFADLEGVHYEAGSDGLLTANAFAAEEPSSADVLRIDPSLALTGSCNIGFWSGTLVGDFNDNNKEPDYVVNARGPFRLAGTSNAADHCPAGPPVDLDGDVRPVNGTYDAGAFEAD